MTIHSVMSWMQTNVGQRSLTLDRCAYWNWEAESWLNTLGHNQKYSMALSSHLHSVFVRCIREQIEIKYKLSLSKKMEWFNSWKPKVDKQDFFTI